ncbi:MAG TPA: MFS transporter [Solirubrobacterales bacterium]|nr:MFS transporter [Solirubrobacterales bacterium]
MPAVVAASFAARLPLSMMGLATILFVQARSGSIAVAGFSVAAFSLTAALLAPVRGRLVDRRGIRGGLLPLSLAHAGATAALLAVAGMPAADPMFVAVAALGGATAPPVNAAMRALWSSLVEPERRDSAYALETVLQEVAFLAGPLVTGLLISLVSTSAPIVVAACLTALGGALFAAQPAAAKLPREARRSRLAIHHPGVRVLIASLALGAVAAGVLEVAIPAFSQRHGTAASAGLLISVMSAASLVGGVWYGARRWHLSPAMRFIGASAVAIVGYGITLLAASTVQMAAGLVVFGFTLSPLLAAVYSILDEVAPRGSAVESVTWITTASAGGAALGAFLSGIVIDRGGIGSALGVGLAAMAMATAIAVLWRGHLGATVRTGKAGPNPASGVGSVSAANPS